MSVIRLTCYCPDTNCVNNRTPLEWVHNDCGADVYLDRDGYIHCYKCPTSYLILNSKFKCSKCTNWCQAKFTRLVQILSVIASLDLKNVGRGDFTNESLNKFLDDLTENLFKLSGK